MKAFKTILFILTTLIVFRCGDYLNVNNDPSFPQVAPGEVILPPLFQEMARGDVFDSRFFGGYVQNWARTTSNYASDIHGYFAGSDALGEKWRQHYWAIGKNIDLIVDDALANEKWWYAGVALAIRAWSWQTSTDVYGEMILKQAWEPNRYVFDYDPQEEIYAEVVRLCDEALTYLDMEDTSNSLAIGDLAYGGDPEKWKKFVYAIRARNAHHISNKPSYDPDVVIGFVDQAMASNADNFNVPHDGLTSDNSNFFGPLRGNLGSFRQTAFALSLVDSTLFPNVYDPRIRIMFKLSLDSVYRGLINGGGNPFTSDSTAIPTLYDQYIYKNNADYPIFTYAEMQFMKAEAAFIKGDLPVALDAYTEGIKAHMDFAGVKPVERDTYLLSAAVAQNTGELDLSDIMIQKYIAMYGHGILETWVDMRRYHYDPAVYPGFTLPDPLSSVNDGKPAYRARPRYNSEYVWNVKALEKIGATNLDYHTYEPWFIQP